jgi:hypothetical protein
MIPQVSELIPLQQLPMLVPPLTVKLRQLLTQNRKHQMTCPENVVEVLGQSSV